jgi:ADP-heptose:LPS heptosyltransferase
VKRILVIKLAALGDVVQAFGPFAAIRAHHQDARIALLTTPPYAPLLRASPWFDSVHDGGRPSWIDLPALWRLARWLRRGGFARVYDLQTSARSSRYRWAVGHAAEWSGIARGASHPHDNPLRDSLHTAARQREQLERAGISRFPAPSLTWLDADIGRFGLPPDFVLLIPGASPQRPAKRWPAARYAELATLLDRPCVVLGGPAERAIAAAIPGTIDLTGRTSLLDIAALARHAACAVGNDTGPTHLVAAAGCPTLALFGEDSDPALCAPVGGRVAVLRQRPLAALTAAEVAAAIAARLAQKSGSA